MTPQEVLEKAALLLEVDGWTQGIAHDNQGRHCVAGAMEYAMDRSSSGGFKSGCFNYDTYNEAVDRLRNAINIAPFYGVTVWNDAPERTAEEVINALRKAAE